MIEAIRRKPVSKPRPYKDIRGKYKWVVYFYDIQKDVRAKKLFVDKLSATLSTRKNLLSKIGLESKQTIFR